MIINVGYEKSIEIKHCTARTLSLDIKNSTPKITRSSRRILEDITFYDDIIELNFHDKYIIKLGDTITLKGKNIKYKINFILSEIDGNYYLQEEPLNKSTSFILPLVLSGNYSDYLFNTCYFNSYILDSDYNSDYLYVVYKFIDIEGYKNTERKLTKQKNFIKVIDVNKTFSAFVFSIPNNLEEVFTLFWQGKYHKIDEKYKQRIINFYTDAEGISRNIKYLTEKGLSNDIKKRKMLEANLGCKIPENINIVSKPKIKDEIIKI